MLDSISVKTAEPERGRDYDAGKKVKGRKRDLLVDVLGLIFSVYVLSASGQDRDGARTLLGRLAHPFGLLVLIGAAGGYFGKWSEWVWGAAKAQDSVGDHQTIGRLWICGIAQAMNPGTNGRLAIKWRRLRCDYETRINHGEELIYIAMMGVMTRRLARKK